MKKQLKNISKKEDGAALVLAMMVLLVLTVLGAMVGVVTVGSHRLSDNNRDYNSAYYIAEAGANMAYEEFKAEVIETYKKNEPASSFFLSIDHIATAVSKVDKYGEGDFDIQLGYQPTTTINIVPDNLDLENNEKEYTIESTGKVANKERMVQKKVKITGKEDGGIGENQIPTIPLGASVIVKDKLYYKSGVLKGDVYIDSDKKDTFVVEQDSWGIQVNNIYTKYPGETGGPADYKEIFNTPDWMLNNSEFKKNVIKKTSEKDLAIDWNALQSYITNLTAQSDTFEKREKLAVKNGVTQINNNYKLSKMDLRDHNIKTIDIGSNDVVIIVDELKNHNGFHTEITGDGTLTIIVLDTASFEGGSNFNTTNRSNLRIIYNGQDGKVKINNNSQVAAQIISPKSQVSFEGGGTLYGTVMAHSVRMDNGMNIQSHDFEFNEPKTSTGPKSELDIKEIISSHPAIEQ